MSIEAMKQALAEAQMLVMPVPAKEVTALEIAKAVSDRAVKLCTLLEQAIAEAEKQEQGEPVACIDMKEWPPIRFKEGTLRCDIEHLDGQALYTTPPRQDQGEPVGIVLEVNNKQVNRDWLALVKIDRGVSVGTKLYITPQQRTWVGLTVDEVDEAARYCVKSGQSVNAAIRAIEAKLKEKNSGP